MKLPWLASIFAFLAGALVTVQAGSNAQLKQGFDTPMPALLVNYVLGFTAVLGYACWPAYPGLPWVRLPAYLGELGWEVLPARSTVLPLSCWPTAWARLL